MNKYVETIAFDLGIRHLVLWGGVQAGNERAIRFYEKIGYRPMGRFFYEGRENFDMAKAL
jgi:diamine N-acetyltransferase